MEKHIITDGTFLQRQVCSEGTFDEALAWLQETDPAGTQNNWQKDERECVKPIQCDDYPNRTHYIFTC